MRWLTLVSLAACGISLGWNYLAPGGGQEGSTDPRLIARLVERELLARDALGEGLAGRVMGWWSGGLDDEGLVEAIASYERAVAAWDDPWESEGDGWGFWDLLSMAVAAWLLGDAEQADRLGDQVRGYPGWEGLPPFEVGAGWEGEGREGWRESWAGSLRAFEGRRDLLPYPLLAGYDGLFGEPLPDDLAAVATAQREVMAARAWAVGLSSLGVVVLALVLAVRWVLPGRPWRVMRAREVRVLSGAGVWRALGAWSRAEIVGLCVVAAVGMAGYFAVELAMAEGEGRWVAESAVEYVTWALFLLVPALVASLLLFPGPRAAWRGLLAVPAGAWPGWWRLAAVFLGISWAGNGLLFLLVGDRVGDWVGDVLEDSMLATGWEGWLAFCGSALVAVVAAPVGEEILYRGILFGGLRRRLGVVVAALAVNLLFAAAHYYSLLGFFSVLLDGLLFTFLYWRTGSLWAPILMHAGFNLFAIVPAWLFYGVL